MFKFHKIGNNTSQGWLCLIDSDKGMQAYLDYMARRVLMNWRYIKASPENKEGHCATSEAGAYKTLLIVEMAKKGVEQMSFADSIEFLTKIATKSTIDIFHRNGEVYISQIGACRPSTDLLDCEKIIDKTVRKDFIFPVRSKKDYKITKWPGGNHFYILENDNSIEIDGVSKWNTVGLAQQALDDHWKWIGYKARRDKEKYPNILETPVT